ncbi:thioesterase family protein [Lipingzhangella rawalii]|uniref:thioesterase family protein n=1 Tax=Lipingzhangella rawalii TaxID=2055835 RepID=UPI00287B624E|nr:hotdog domain-containing protein [Lipingzhangella rawalii]
MTADVTHADTARALGSGDVLVLGTPRVLSLVEAATVAAVSERLPEERTSVGTDVALAHTAPSPVGARVVATAELTEVSGRHLTFTVELSQDGSRVAHGTVQRAVVSRQRFEGA